MKVNTPFHMSWVWLTVSPGQDGTYYWNQHRQLDRNYLPLDYDLAVDSPLVANQHTRHSALGYYRLDVINSHTHPEVRLTSLLQHRSSIDTLLRKL
jgi:hypothetical protein